MPQATTTPAFRHVPRLSAVLIHLCLLALVFALFMGRKPGLIRSEALASALPGVYSHVSNFSLSYLLLAGVGFLWLMFGVPMRMVALAALAMAGANLAFEFLIPVLNTRDPIDAVYGLVGTAFAFGVLWLLARFGMRPNPALPAAE